MTHEDKAHNPSPPMFWNKFTELLAYHDWEEAARRANEWMEAQETAASGIAARNAVSQGTE